MATPSAIHHVLAILAGDSAPGVEGDAADSLVRLIARLGGGGLARDSQEAGGVPEVTAWFVRVTFPGIAPPDAFIVAVATAAGFCVETLAAGPPGPFRWLLVAPQSRGDISSAVARLRAAHRIHAVPFRKLEGR